MLPWKIQLMAKMNCFLDIISLISSLLLPMAFIFIFCWFPLTLINMNLLCTIVIVLVIYNLDSNFFVIDINHLLVSINFEWDLYPCFYKICLIRCQWKNNSTWKIYSIYTPCRLCVNSISHRFAFASVAFNLSNNISSI